jgi:hypothetical protein
MLNLDAMNEDELLEVVRSKTNPTNLYGAYANSKLNAMQFRNAGCIELALSYEQNCERIYNSLPKALKW